LRGGRVVNIRTGIVEEGVAGIGVNANFAVHAVLLEGFFQSDDANLSFANK